MCRDCREVVKTSWQVVCPMDALPANRTWQSSLFVFFISLLIVAQHVSGNHVPILTTFLQPQHIPTRGYNVMQSSAPEDGHMVAQNMLSNY